MPEVSLERVATAVGEMADQARLLAGEVKEENELRRRQDRKQTILIVILLLGTVLIGAMLVKQVQDSSARSAAATQQRMDQLRLARQINDCLDPAGKCALESRANQQRIIGIVADADVISDRCVVIAEGRLSAYDACMAANGVVITTDPATGKVTITRKP